MSNITKLAEQKRLSIIVNEATNKKLAGRGTISGYNINVWMIGDAIYVEQWKKTGDTRETKIFKFPGNKDITTFEKTVIDNGGKWTLKPGKILDAPKEERKPYRLFQIRPGIYGLKLFVRINIWNPFKEDLARALSSKKVYWNKNIKYLVIEVPSIDVDALERVIEKHRYEAD